jgi:hypothetical protein
VLQGNLLQGLAASEYNQILEDKNYHIDLYKKHAFLPGDRDELPQETRLLQLRDHIDKLNRDSQAKLNQLLLDEFSIKLGIKYEEAQLTGKPKKRVLTIVDINTLEPFHWGYHFDKVFAQAGFDAIIANPPWEIFKPQAKEFFFFCFAIRLSLPNLVSDTRIFSLFSFILATHWLHYML